MTARGRACDSRIEITELLRDEVDRAFAEQEAFAIPA
jgi:hypothetical protein